MTALLETVGLTVTFGGLHANDSIDTEIREGSFVGLIGPNGAGKTTFVDAITGFVPMSRGEVRFDGGRIDHLATHQRATLGLSRTFQSLELFEDLTVRENLLAAADRPRFWSFVADMVRPDRRPVVQDDIEWALEVVGLGHTSEQLPTDLSHGQRKLVGAARAIASRPRLVLLDEPAAGLDTTESHALGGRLRSLLDHDMTVFLIDHDMGLVLNVCDYIYVLDFGQLIARGTPAQIRNDPTVIAAYLGDGADQAQAPSIEDRRRRSGEDDS